MSWAMYPRKNIVLCIFYASDLTWVLTLIRMAEGVYNSRNFEQKQLKWPEVKIFLTYIHPSQNVLE